MKKLLVIVLALVCYSVQAQKWGYEFGSNYVYTNPIGGMGRNIQQGHGVALNFGFVNPNQRFAFGTEINLSQYGSNKTRQEYTFEDGSVAPMDIIVSNYFASLMAYSRWYLNAEGSVRPFLTGKIGYSGFNTDLDIYDPDDMDHCEPVDNDVLYQDGTMIAVVGAGVKVDFAAVFKKLPKGLLCFESSVNFTQGGQVSYMSADADAHAHHNGHSNGGEEVTAEFINTQTQVIHEHHVGNLYTNPVQMTELRFGISMNFLR